MYIAVKERNFLNVRNFKLGAQMAYKPAAQLVYSRSIETFVFQLIFVLAIHCGYAGAAEPSERAQSLNWNSAVGINLGGVSYYSTEIVFVDLFKHSQPWKSQGPGKPYGRAASLPSPKMDGSTPLPRAASSPTQSF